MKALLIVDVQNDFCPGGALGVKQGDEIVPVINDILKKFDLVLASKDWHPEKTVHFEKWPPHCIKDSEGAELFPLLNSDKIDFILLKGTNNADDGYSAFEATNIPLKELLIAEEVDQLYIAGIATDYCVKKTALDAIKEGFKTFVVSDAIAAVNISPDDDKKAIEEMKASGCIFVKHNEILK